MRFSWKTRKNIFARAAATFLVCFSAVYSGPALATTLSWTFTGPGTTQVLEAEDTTVFTYFLAGGGDTTQTWTATTVAPSTGTFKFNWNFSGFHAITGATAFLEGLNPAETIVPETSVPGGFAFTERGFAVTVTEGETFGFSFGGSNSDSADVLSGQFAIAAVPLPAALLPMLLGLFALGVTARRREA